ncbi:MAG: DNA polymerase III subunit delta' [Limnochordia bacterium]|jgi:DNA polymerase-3 subunit delta'
MWESVPGQGHIQATLQRALAKGSLAHAYLFIGPDGLGQEQIIQQLGLALACQEGLPPCGRCDGCRAAASGDHPDFHRVAPQGSRIGIDQIRSLQEILSLQPYIGPWRYCVIEEAEALTREAANSFLKLLEEPGPKVVFILCCRNVESMLSTIISRCQSLTFRPVPASVIREELLAQGVPGPRAEMAAALAGGRPGQARSFLEDSFLEERQEAVESLLALPHGRTGDLLALAERWSSQRELTHRYLDYLVYWFRDLLVLVSGGGEQLVMNRDYLDKLKEQAQNYRAEGLLEALDKVQGCRRRLAGNANRRLLLEELFFTLSKEVV